MVVRDRLKEMQEASPHCVAGEDVEIEMKPLKGKKAGADGMATFLVVAGVDIGIAVYSRHFTNTPTKVLLSTPLGRIYHAL